MATVFKKAAKEQHKNKNPSLPNGNIKIFGLLRNLERHDVIIKLYNP